MAGLFKRIYDWLLSLFWYACFSLALWRCTARPFAMDDEGNQA